MPPAEVWPAGSRLPPRAWTSPPVDRFRGAAPASRENTLRPRGRTHGRPRGAVCRVPRGLVLFFVLFNFYSGENIPPCPLTQRAEPSGRRRGSRAGAARPRPRSKQAPPASHPTGHGLCEATSWMFSRPCCLPSAAIGCRLGGVSAQEGALPSLPPPPRPRCCPGSVRSGTWGGAAHSHMARAPAGHCPTLRASGQPAPVTGARPAPRHPEPTRPAPRPRSHGPVTRHPPPCLSCLAFSASLPCDRKPHDRGQRGSGHVCTTTRPEARGAAAAGQGPAK